MQQALEQWRSGRNVPLPERQGAWRGSSPIGHPPPLLGGDGEDKLRFGHDDEHDDDFDR